MTEEQEKVIGWTIDMHLVIDEQGKVKVTQDLLDAFRVRRGDMLSFHFDTTQDIVTVTGSRKPPHFHDEEHVQIIPITRGTPTDLSLVPGERATPQTPVIPNSPTSVPRSREVTQPALFDAGQQKPPISHRRRPQK